MPGVQIQSWHEAEAWNELVLGQPDAAIYHRYEWRRVFEQTLHLPTLYLAAQRDGVLEGVLPLVRMRVLTGEKMLISLPFVNYAGICARSEEARRALFEQAVAAARDAGCQWIELRHGRETAGDWVVRRHKVRHFVPLADTPDRMWERLGAKLRNQVGKSMKNGLEPRIGGAELLRNFYGVYLRNMRALGSPPLPAAFFQAVLAEFGPAARICLVDLGCRTVAGAVLLGSGQALEIPWAASLPRYRPLAPVMLLYWTAIRHATEAGYRIFDMGRSSPGSGSDHFKRQWKSECEPLPWHYWIRSGAGLPAFTEAGGRLALLRTLWSWMPIVLVKNVGTRVIRYIPG